MATYYTFIPDSDMPTAEVTAPDSRHARTTYLDYLSRGGKIQYSDRTRTRDLIKINRMDPGEFRTSIKLDYGVSEPTEEEEIPVPGSRVYEEDAEMLPSERGTVGRDQPTDEEADEFLRQAEEEVPEASTMRPLGKSPIMDLSKKSGGM